MTGSIYFKVMGPIHLVLGGQSAPGLLVAQYPEKAIMKTSHCEVPGHSVDWQTLCHSMAAVK